MNEWTGVKKHLASLHFDTRASNIGINAGAITVVQRSFDQRQLFVACRHHVLEIFAAAVITLFI